MLLKTDKAKQRRCSALLVRQLRFQPLQGLLWGLSQLYQLEIGFPLTQLKLLRELSRCVALYLHVLGLVRLSMLVFWYSSMG